MIDDVKCPFRVCAMNCPLNGSRLKADSVTSIRFSFRGKKSALPDVSTTLELSHHVFVASRLRKVQNMWFTENPWPPIILAGFGALVCFGLWNNERRNLYLILTLVCLGAMGAIYALERAIITDGEKLQAEVVVLCQEFRRRDPAALEHFSSTAPELKSLCKTAMEMVEIGDDLRLTDFHTKLTGQNSRASVHFRANATISVMGWSGHHPFRCILDFQKEAGSWKIVEVQRLDPIKGDKIDMMEKR